MSEFYDDMAATVLEMFEEFGKIVTLTRAAGGTQAVVALEEVYSVGAIDGTTILRGDVKLLLATTDTNGAPVTAPRPKADRITYASGKAFLIQNADPLSPGDTPVYFTLQLRA